MIPVSEWRIESSSMVGRMVWNVAEIEYI